MVATSRTGPVSRGTPSGRYLRSQRQLAQLSLRQLAALTKVSNPYLSQIERGLHQPSIGVIKSLAEALNLSVGDLLAHAADIVTGEEAATTTEAAIRRRSAAQRHPEGALLAVYPPWSMPCPARTPAAEDPTAEDPTVEDPTAVGGQAEAS